MRSWSPRAWWRRPGTRGSGLRGQGGGTTTNLDDVLRLLVAAASEADPSPTIRTVLRAMTECGLATRCDLLTWRQDWAELTGRASKVRRDPPHQRRWTSAVDPEEPVFVGPGDHDVLVESPVGVVGFLRLTPAPSPEDGPTLAVLARGFAVILHDAMASWDLERLRHRAIAARGELADRRQRAAVELDRTRSDLERDLHDGAQGDLVSLRMRIGLAHQLQSQAPLAQDDSPGLAELHPTVLLAAAERLQAKLVAVAAGLVPTTLLSHGLPAALRADLPVEGVGAVELLLSPTLESRRYPPDVEEAVYFICVEAVTNARKHAPGSHVSVRLDATYRGLEIVVADTGPGFDGTGADGAFGALHERADSIGARLDIRSSRADGTTVTTVVAL